MMSAAAPHTSQSMISGTTVGEPSGPVVATVVFAVTVEASTRVVETPVGAVVMSSAAVMVDVVEVVSPARVELTALVRDGKLPVPWSRVEFADGMSCID